MREAAFPHCEKFIPMINHVGISRIPYGARLAPGFYYLLWHLEELTDTAINRAIKLSFCFQVACFNPAIFILNLTILEIHRMHHAIAIQRIDIIVWLKRHIGAVTHKSTRQIGGHFALNRQLVFAEITFFIDGRIIAL